MKFKLGDIVQNKTTRKVGIVKDVIDRKGSGGWYYEVHWLHNSKTTRPSQSTLKRAT